MRDYRPDIDGLRAIAVASVVLYHLQESLLPGGFVGVDIFFVISGYLITKLIYSELSETSTFSYKRFYIRRVRRLFPALLTTLLLCLVLAYLLFSPAHLTEFAQSLIASVLSVSNIFFWSVADYFDSDSLLKPLLHTWSLSVEEQFYFIWPAMLVGLFSLRKQRCIPIFILFIGLASLMLNLALFADLELIRAWFATDQNQVSFDLPSTAFYWLPFRVFEFAIGAILVWIGSTDRKFIAEGAFALGLAMVIISFFTLSSEMNFPSTAALLPCIGAALIIFSGGKHRLSGLVTNRAMVGMGLISYSLYLIHWPLIVFYQYSTGRALANSEIILLIMVSVLVAWFMYRFVEQPFRKKAHKGKLSKRSPNRVFLIGSAASALITIAIGVNAVSSKGWLWRYPADMVAQLSYKKGDYTEFFWSNIKRLEDGFDKDDRPKVLVIGDSMAADLVNVLVAARVSQQMDIATVAINDNCKALFGFSETQYKRRYGGAADKCQREHTRILTKHDVLRNADTIVLASYLWDMHQIKAVPQTVAYLKTLTDARIMVLGLKTQRNNGIYFVSKHAFSLQGHKLRTPPHANTEPFNAVLINQAVDYAYFDLLDLFCNKDGCLRMTKDGFAIIFDDTHLSEQGANFLARDIQTKDWFKKMLEQK